ncbi:3D domain-containing protein [Oceanobacillus neutriphilus]|uniref:3D domain-containing protein n=1 Tax=Oceanobacillus neutriphilus TaxID=531815 RepID=A0ABQ2NY94_9BACI|nr:3D domain-containing protein [Oceanobacillus neutriphilus]GGP13522.1 hypothetical protein GCM10011346_33850 [Oceanobacillus neutriphilus]
MHSESFSELEAEKVSEWDDGELTASITTVEEEKQAKKEAKKKAEAEEAKKLEETSDETRELDSENVRETTHEVDADGDINGHGEGGQEAGAQEDEGASEIPEGEVVGTFEATAYIAFCDTGCTGVTASGYDVSSTIYSPEGLRIVAADPGVLPLGSTVEINSGGNTIQAVVMDTGGDINGNRLDLLVGSEAEAREYGRQSVELRVIE